jgi:hypothetical protein
MIPGVTTTNDFADGQRAGFGSKTHHYIYSLLYNIFITTGAQCCRF